jgi:hypothetical protein
VTFLLNQCHFTLPEGYKADVYALAIVFSQLANPTPNLGFCGDGDGDGDGECRPVLLPGLNPRVSELICRMWDESPSTRPLCNDILNTLLIPAEERVSEDEFYRWFDSESDFPTPSINMNTDDSNTSSSAD